MNYRYLLKLRSMLEGAASVSLYLWVTAADYEKQAQHWNHRVQQRGTRLAMPFQEALTTEMLDRRLGQMVYFLGAVGWLGFLAFLAGASNSAGASLGAALAYSLWLLAPGLVLRAWPEPCFAEVLITKSKPGR